MCLRNDAWLMSREKEKKSGQRQQFLPLSDKYCLPYFLCKYPTALFQKKRMDVSTKKSDW